MTPFFLPEVHAGDPAGELAYDELRRQAEACTGFHARDRRIVEIECRHRGVDRRLRVGESDAENGMTVEAILQLGRDVYTVHHLQTTKAAQSAPKVLRRTEVYSVVDFD
ncbi:MAG: hypothetical protein QOI03_1781 [Solirubrobacteraceae bacterium]|jgi:hypothetical protein|nr:hypothetical protein [Solirubrobacteraceae bacterium]